MRLRESSDENAAPRSDARPSKLQLRMQRSLSRSGRVGGATVASIGPPQLLRSTRRGSPPAGEADDARRRAAARAAEFRAAAAAKAEAVAAEAAAREAAKWRARDMRVARFLQRQEQAAVVAGLHTAAPSRLPQASASEAAAAAWQVAALARPGTKGGGVAAGRRSSVLSSDAALPPARSRYGLTAMVDADDALAELSFAAGVAGHRGSGGGGGAKPPRETAARLPVPHHAAGSAVTAAAAMATAGNDGVDERADEPELLSQSVLADGDGAGADLLRWLADEGE